MTSDVPLGVLYCLVVPLVVGCPVSVSLPREEELSSCLTRSVSDDGREETLRLKLGDENKRCNMKVLRCAMNVLMLCNDWMNVLMLCNDWINVLMLCNDWITYSCCVMIG